MPDRMYAFRRQETLLQCLKELHKAIVMLMAFPEIALYIPSLMKQYGVEDEYCEKLGTIRILFS
jgi:hypothetical protein